MRALVGAGKTGVSSVPGGGKRISMSGTMPSLTSSSAIRSGDLGEVAQDRRQPLLEEDAVAVVAAVVDRALGLRRGAAEVQDQPLAVRVVGRRAGQRDPLRVQHGLVDAVVLGVVLPHPLPDGDLGEDLAAVRRRGAVDDRVEARLDRLDAVPVEQLAEPARAHQARGALGVEVGREALGHPGVAGHDAERGPVGHARVPQSDRRHHQALLEDAGGVRGHRAGDRAADVVVVAEGLHERDDLALALGAREDRNRHAEVGQVPDPALGAVDVVVEEDVTLLHLLDREVAGDRVDQRAVGATGELAQQPVVDAGAEVVSVADHRAAAGAADRGLDLHLDRRERALDDLHEHRVGARAGVAGQVAERELGGSAAAGGVRGLRDVSGQSWGTGDDDPVEQVHISCSPRWSRRGSR